MDAKGDVCGIYVDLVYMLARFKKAGTGLLLSCIIGGHVVVVLLLSLIVTPGRYTHSHELRSPVQATHMCLRHTARHPRAIIAAHCSCIVYIRSIVLAFRKLVCATTILL